MIPIIYGCPTSGKTTLRDKFADVGVVLVDTDDITKMYNLPRVKNTAEALRVLSLSYNYALSQGYSPIILTNLIWNRSVDDRYNVVIGFKRDIRDVMYILEKRDPDYYYSHISRILNWKFPKDCIVLKRNEYMSDFQNLIIESLIQKGVCIEKMSNSIN